MLKSSKKPGASKNKPTDSDEEDEGNDEEESEDESDNEGEDMAVKGRSSSEDGTDSLYCFQNIHSLSSFHST